ncbi:General transcription factor IIIC, polypeptide 3 [Chamberlinius hualienensis]
MASILFKNLTDRNLSEEQLDEFRKIKKLTRGLVVQDSESSDSSSDNDYNDVLLSDTEHSTNPAPSTVTTEVAISKTNDVKRKQLVKRYTDGEISFAEFTQLLQDQKWSLNENVTQRDEKLSSSDVEDDVDLSYEDNENDEDYIPPRSLKKRKLHEKQEMTVPSSFIEKIPCILLPIENIFEPEASENKKWKHARSKLPAYLGGLLGQARLSLVRNDQESAIKMCLEVIRLGGHSPEVYETLEMIYEDSGDLYKILSTRIMVATLKVNDAQAWANVAEVYAELDQLNDAAKCYQKAVRYDLTNIPYKWTLFHLLEKLNRKEKSFELLQQIVKDYSPEDGENILLVTKEIAERQFKDGLSELAKTTMEEAFFKHLDHIVSEDVNFLLDLKIKLREYSQSVKDMRSTLLQSNSEETGDLYLDVAEAYVETGNASEALPILATLVSTQKYDRPLVWQKYGECQMTVGNLKEAELIYKHILEIAPDHPAARLRLSGILQQLGRFEESVEVLTNRRKDDVLLDPVLHIQKATMLYSREKWDEFVDVAKILHSANTLWKKGYKDNGTYCTCYVRNVRELYKQWKDEMPGYPLIEERSVHTEEIWDIYKQMCQKMLELGRLRELQRDCHFMHFLACFFNNSYKRVYYMIRIYVFNGETGNRLWNLFNIILNSIKLLRPSRFCLRQLYMKPDNIQLGLINGHIAYASRGYKHALAEYMNVFRRCPNDPLIAFCIGITFIRIAHQKFTIGKNDAVVQAIAFFNIYRELRGDTQEVCYNQLGLLYVAVDYYKQALAKKPTITSGPNSEVYDLSHLAAFNLSLIYNISGNHNLALLYLHQYCTV